MIFLGYTINMPYIASNIINIKLIKKTITIFAVGLIAVVAFTVPAIKEKSMASSMLQQNIEALARAENGQYDFPDGYPYSSRCNVKLSSGWFSGKCDVEILICQGGGNGCNSKSCPVHSH